MSDVRGQVDDGPEVYAEDVSRAYRLAAREEPSPELDAAIHAAAERAARARPRYHAGRSLGRWGVPIAVAATIVIGVSIAFLAADRPDAPLAPDAPVPQGRESKPSVLAPSSEAIPADPIGQPARPRAETSGGQAPVAAAAREARPSRERTTRDQLVPRRDQAVTPGASQESEARPEPPAAAAIEAPRSSPVPEAARVLRKTAPVADTAAGEEAEPVSPEVWLQRIRELRNRGELAQADASLRAFRRRYPDYPLPADVPAPAGK